MQDTHSVEHGNTASRIEVLNVFNPSAQISDSFDFHKQDEDIPKWTKVGTRFDQPTASRIEVDDTDSTPIFEWGEDFNLGLPYPKPYPNFTVLDSNSTLLREMLSEIDALLTNEYDWDEIDYRKPTLEDINFAKDTLIKFVKVISCYEGCSLTKPYISNSEDGGAKIEWHSDNNKRSLYLRIACHESVATKIWDESDKTNINNEPFLQENYLSLWKWIS